jgi:hypothetical protein
MEIDAEAIGARTPLHMGVAIYKKWVNKDAEQ